MRQHLHGHAAKHDGREAVSAMRGHCDQVTAVLLCRIDDGAVRMLVLDMDHSAAKPAAAAASLTFFRYFAVSAVVRFL